MKKTFTAYAIMENEGNQITVTIYSNYKNQEEAQAGIDRFIKRYYGTKIEVVNAWIE